MWRRWALKEAVLKACGSWRLPFPEMYLAAGESIDLPPEGIETVLAPHLKRTGRGPSRVAFSGSSANLLAAHRIQVRPADSAVALHGPRYAVVRV